MHPGIGPVSEDVLGGRHLPYVTTAERRAWEAKKPRPPEPRVQALWDRGQPSPTYLYLRGDPLRPGPLVGPGVPSVLTDGKTPFEVKPPWPGALKTGRRLAFARWLIRPENPLTARVAVNRLWRQHFGSGLVPTLGNFGKSGLPPTHPELLDWLAREFLASPASPGHMASPGRQPGEDWGSFKALHRLMVTSATYRQSSTVTAAQEQADPDNALYSRRPLVRLDAEQTYDTLVRAAGRLDPTPFGPAAPVQTRPDGLVTPAETARGWRRLIYVQQARKRLPTHLETFDAPTMNPNCLERRDSTVAPQALYLLNNAMILRLADDLARRVAHEAGTDPAAQVERVYLLTLGRPARPAEKELGIAALKQLGDIWSGIDRGVAGSRALATYCHAVLNSAGFLYVD